MTCLFLYLQFIINLLEMCQNLKPHFQSTEISITTIVTLSLREVTVPSFVISTSSMPSIQDVVTFLIPDLNPQRLAMRRPRRNESLYCMLIAVWVLVSETQPKHRVLIFGLYGSLWLKPLNLYPFLAEKGTYF